MEDLSLHILDVAENGIIAGATLIEITVEEDVKGDRLTVTVRDNGRGMEPEFLARVLDPFTATRTTRKVGLGLSLFQQSAQEAGGRLEIESTPGAGTKVMAFMSHGHIDRKPMGNMVATVTTLIEGNPEVDFVYTHRINSREYVLDTRELRQELEEIPLNNPQVVAWINEHLTSGLREIA
ncbi:MAG: ATP-binding protein [Deltaproteobacteria bacterium]|nr:ATP-binding protein [Deltaproteobacteria bacterium]